MGTLQDLIDEAKVRLVWWGTCIFAICYLFSHTSKSMWTNLPISVLLALALRILIIHVEFHWKPPPSRVQNYLFYLENKQVPISDSRLSTPPLPRKWKRKIDSPSVQAAIEEFIDLIVRDFVIDLWYSGITPDKEAPELIRGIVLDAIGEVAGRIKEVNLVGLLTRDMIDLVGDHIEMYRRNQTFIGVDVMGTLSSEERDERLKQHLMSSKQLHPALVSPESEHKFLQQLMGGVIALVLRQKEVQCPLVRCIARELLTCLVIQPLIKLASPMYINELIEHIILNNKPETEGGDDESSKTHNSCFVPSQESDVLAPDKVGSLREKALEVSDCLSLTSNGGTTQQKTADWARVLDAASKRRTEVLAPDNLENMWAKGRNYKVKLSSAAKVHHAYGTKDLASSVTLSSDLQKLGYDNKVEGPRIDDKANIQFAQSSNHTNEPQHVEADEPKLPDGLAVESKLRGAMMEDNGASPRAGVVKKISLKKSISTSALKNESVDRKANSYETKGISISEEYYGPDYGKHNMELQYKGAPDSPRATIQAEAFRYPTRLRCRVIGAYFEKIGSKSFAVYSVAVTDLENKTWFVKRRYRNFERLHRHLKDIPNYTLHLPPKRIFSSSTEDAFVHQRCIQLDKYLQDLLSIPNVAEQHEVWDFLSVSSKNYSFGKSPSVMSTLAVNVDEAVDDIVRQFKGVSDGLMRKVVGSSPSYRESMPHAPFRSLSWNAREVRRQFLGHSSIERSNSSSDDEDVSITPTHRELSTSAEASVCHSDSEFDAKDFDQHIVKQIEATKSLDMGKYGLESKYECMDRDQATSLPFTSNNLEDLVGVPPEWSPPNVTVPALNLVDKIFQLNKRGWLRRQVFWMSKQILQLAMEDAIDDWIIGQLSCLRRDDVIAQGIGWIKDTLWPEGKFFKNLQNNSGGSDDIEFDNTSSQPDVCLSGSFETQLQAARRASEVKKLLFNGAPTALVSLVGQKQYKRCARDIYYFLQSSICIKQLIYGALELIIVSVFPELKDLVMDIHKKMGYQPSCVD